MLACGNPTHPSPLAAKKKSPLLFWQDGDAVETDLQGRGAPGIESEADLLQRVKVRTGPLPKFVAAQWDHKVSPAFPRLVVGGRA